MLDFLDRSTAVAEAIGRQGRNYVRSTYSWQQVRKRWLEALRDVATSVRLRSEAP
jgi:hypothetical protein